MNIYVYAYLGKYILISFNICMRHSMFDFILHLKNIQSAKEYYTIIQK